MENKKYIDWHTHTIYSDGLDSPAGLVRNSRLLGIQSLAITDHDILAGYWEALLEADKGGIELVPGVEISTEVYHILGFGIDPKNPELNRFLDKVQGLQAKICERRMEKLQAAGFSIDMKKLKAAFPKSRLGKYNILLAMLRDAECAEKIIRKYGNIPSDEAFRLLFGNNGIAGEIENENSVESKEAIERIHAAGGIAIVAHPFKEAKTPRDLDSLLKDGIDGLEIQPNYNGRNVQFAEYAKQHNLLLTYGSDYHGAGFSRPLLGRGGDNYDNRIDVKEFFRRSNA